VRRDFAIFALFLTLAIAFTWPLALHLDTAAADRGDPLLTAWILDWVDYSLTHAPLHLYSAPIYHPGIYPLAYSENLVGLAVLMLPLHLLGLSPLTIQNIALILGYAFSAYGMFVLARLITRHTLASIVAAIAFAFGSFMVAHVQHIQIVWSGWLPLTFAALFVYWRTPTTKHAALLCGAFVMNGLTNVYWLMFGGFMIVVTIAFLAVADPRRDRAFWMRLFASLVVAGVILTPFLIPYQIVARTYGAARTTGESRGGSASFIDWLAPSSRNALYGPLADPQWHRDERELFPGLLVIFLAIVGLVERRPLRPPDSRERPAAESGRRSTMPLDIAIVVFGVLTYLTTVQDRITIGHFSFAGSDVPATITVALILARLYPRWKNSSRFNAEERAAGVWILVGFVASLGWNAFLHPFLFRVLTPFRATRTPARWAVIVYMGLAVWAAMGFVALMERTKRKRLVASIVIALAIVETVPRIRWDQLDPRIAPVYTWLAQTKPGVVLELPILAHGVPYEYILANTIHRVPLINGASGWETPLHGFLRTKEDKLEYDDAFLKAAIDADCAIVIVHEARLTPERKAALGPMLQKLIPLRRFGSDVVFRTRRVLAETASAPRESLPR